MLFGAQGRWLRIGWLVVAALCLGAPARAQGWLPPLAASAPGLDPVYGDDFESGECALWSVTSNPSGAPDGDLDLFGDENQPTVHCQLPAGHVANLLDCNDNDPAVNPAALEICNGIDDDCDVNSADGVEDPLLGAACDGTGDSDFCLEGTFSCAAGALLCSDATASTPELCAGDAADEDCDGEIDEGFILDDNPACLAATNLGQLSGDTGSTVLAAGSYNEKWYLFRVTEDDLAASAPLKIRISLAVPVGVDFDLYATCFNCTSGQIAASTNGGLSGHTEEIYLGRNDAAGDTSFFVLVEVRYFTSNRCAFWNLTVTRTTDTVLTLCPS